MPSLTCLLLAASLSGAAPPQTRPSAVMLRYPDVSQHAIVFRYAGDLWLVPKDGGEATRISSAPGGESFPKFSPDGTTLAFMAGYGGGSDLYVMPVEGGIPERITHHPATEVLCDWHPDGDRLLFFSPQVSGQPRAPRMFAVEASGGQPELLPPPYGTFGAIDSTGENLAYTPTAREFRTWKRYRGGLAQDVWIFNLKTRAAQRVTRSSGTDSMPMWHGSTLVFLSDRGPEGRLNLFAYESLEDAAAAVEPRQLTVFEEADIRFPSMGPEDVVFENDGKLYRFNFESDEVVPVEVIIPGDRPALREAEHPVSHLATELDLGPTAKRVVLQARGEVFTVPVEKGFVRNLTGTSGFAERTPRWSPDGRWIAYFSDRSGEYEVTLARSDGRGFEGADEYGERQLTELGPGWKYALSWSPDSRLLSFATSDGGLYVLEIESGELTRVATHPAGEPLRSRWAPDARWLTWSHRHSESRLSAIYLYDLRARRAYEVTSGLFDDKDPCFDPEGDWLYFQSSRAFEAISADLDTTWLFADTRQLVAVPLRGDVARPWAPANDEEPLQDPPPGDRLPRDTEGRPASSPDVAAAAESSALQEAPSGAIDLEGLEARAHVLPVARGRFRALEACSAGLLYLREPPVGARGGARQGEADLVFFDPAAPGTEAPERVLLSGVIDFRANASGAQLLVRRADGWGVLDLGEAGVLSSETEAPAPENPGPAEVEESAYRVLDLSSLRARIAPREEWGQLVMDTWRIYRDFFYDPGLHGMDWDAVRDRSLAALDDATSREDVHFLIGEMIAELNVGHAYNVPAPEAVGSQGASAALSSAFDAQPGTGLLGCDWTLSRGRYRIARILSAGVHEADVRSPLATAGVREGEYLIAVNGRRVDAGTDVYAAFSGTAGVPTELTLANSPVPAQSDPPTGVPGSPGASRSPGSPAPGAPSTTPEPGLRAPQADGSTRTVLVTPLESEEELRYRDWVRTRREYVAGASAGQVGYVHVPDTGARGRAELMRQFLGQMHERALIVDERWNTGGDVPTRMIELLDRPLTNFFAVRAGEDLDWPPVGHRGPKAMLINHASGSGGDLLAFYFRQAGLGKLVGTRTWGGTVGISENPTLIDGARTTVPRFAFYELDGSWGLEGRGVDPDVEVVDDPSAMLAGEDPQLEGAVQLLLSELEEWPFVSKTRPAPVDTGRSRLEDRPR